MQHGGRCEDHCFFVCEGASACRAQTTPIVHFLSSQGGGGYGNRSYNWEHKLTFALKAVELGNLLDERLTSKGFDLFHDPDMGKPVSAPSLGSTPSTLYYAMAWMPCGMYAFTSPSLFLGDFRVPGN